MTSSHEVCKISLVEVYKTAVLPEKKNVCLFDFLLNFHGKTSEVMAGQ